MPCGRFRQSLAARLATAILGLGCVVGPPASVAGRSGGAAEPSPQGGTAGVLHRHLAYEAELATAVLSRLEPSEAGIVRELVNVSGIPMSALTMRMAADHQTDASARRAWDARVGTGAPRPGQRTHFACSVGVRRSDAAALGATSDGELSAEFASIELGLLVEGRQLAAALPPDDRLRGVVDASQRQALHVLAALLIPTDRSFAASA